MHNVSSFECSSLGQVRSRSSLERIGGAAARETQLNDAHSDSRPEDADARIQAAHHEGVTLLDVFFVPQQHKDFGSLDITLAAQVVKA